MGGGVWGRRAGVGSEAGGWLCGRKGGARKDVVSRGEMGEQTFSFFVVWEKLRSPMFACIFL